MSRSDIAFVRLANGKTTLVLLVLLAMTMAFGLVVPQHASGEAIGHSYSSSFTQVVTGLQLHQLESSWLTQLIGMLLALNLLAIGLRPVLRLPDIQQMELARSEVIQHALPMEQSPERLDEWLRKHISRPRARLRSRNEARGRLGFRVESFYLVIFGAMTLTFAAIIGSQDEIKLIKVVEGADDTANSSFEATQVINDAELPWKPPFEMECNRSSDGTLGGARQCIITWDGKRHEATVRPGTDLEFLGIRLTLIGFDRLPLSGSLDLDITYNDDGRSRTTASLGVPLDITLPDGRVTAILGGVSDNAPVAILTGKVPSESVTGRLAVSARPRVAMLFRFTETDHMPFLWTGCGLLLLGLVGVALLPAYRINVQRSDTGLVIQIQGFGAFAAPRKLLSTLLPEGAS